MVVNGGNDVHVEKILGDFQILFSGLLARWQWGSDVHATEHRDTDFIFLPFFFKKILRRFQGSNLLPRACYVQPPIYINVFYYLPLKATKLFI